MIAQKVDLQSRAFLFQLQEIFQEFDGIIPWLDEIKKIQYCTDEKYFKEQFYEQLNMREENVIDPYIFTSEGPGKEYLGGFMHFQKSPEHFIDSHNQEQVDLLNSTGYSYVTCLLLRPDLRGYLWGIQKFGQSINEMLKTYPKIWGIVSEPKLLPLYKKAGFSVNSRLLNKDQLWVISQTV